MLFQSTTKHENNLIFGANSLILSGHQEIGGLIFEANKWIVKDKVLIDVLVVIDFFLQLSG